MSSPPSVAADEDMIDELISNRPTSPFTSPTTIVKKGRRKRDETVSSVKPRKPISGSLTVQKRVSSSNLFGPFLEGQTTFSFSPASGSQSISPRAKKSKDPSKGINQASSSPQKKPRSISANKKGIPSPSRRPPQLCSGAAHDVDEPALHDFIPLKLSPVEGFESSVKVEEEDTRVSKSKEGKRARKSNASLPLIKDRGKLKLSATAPIITKPGRRGLDPGPPSRTQIPPSSLSPTSMDNIHSPEYVSKKRMKAQTLPSTAPGTLRSTSAKRPSFSSKSGKRRKSESNHAVIEISSDDDGPRPLKKRRTNLIVLSDEDGPNVTAVPHAPAELDDSISSPPGQTFDFDMGMHPLIPTTTLSPVLHRPSYEYFPVALHLSRC
ncbi:hypothetical protein DL96DRAFT_160032 [Flagelloscypha sp. PMI_526]|nr:hypothetical protein DL96DRAFT_160032 [Flagelloscypha sp. PMI_526]